MNTIRCSNRLLPIVGVLVCTGHSNMRIRSMAMNSKNERKMKKANWKTLHCWSTNVKCSLLYCRDAFMNSCCLAYRITSKILPILYSKIKTKFNKYRFNKLKSTTNTHLPKYTEKSEPIIHRKVRMCICEWI